MPVRHTQNRSQRISVAQGGRQEASRDSRLWAASARGSRRARSCPKPPAYPQVLRNSKAAVRTIPLSEVRECKVDAAEPGATDNPWGAEPSSRSVSAICSSPAGCLSFIVRARQRGPRFSGELRSDRFRGQLSSMAVLAAFSIERTVLRADREHGSFVVLRASIPSQLPRFIFRSNRYLNQGHEHRDRSEEGCSR